MPPVDSPHYAKRPDEGRSRRTSDAPHPERRITQSRQPGAHPPTLVRLDPGGDSVDLPPRVRVSGDRQDSRRPIARRRNTQEERQAVTRHEKCGSPRRAEALVQAVREPHRQSRLPQVCKERLTNRIGIGADDDPNRPKDEDVHALRWGTTGTIRHRCRGQVSIADPLSDEQSPQAACMFARALRLLTHAAALYAGFCLCVEYLRPHAVCQRQDLVGLVQDYRVVSSTSAAQHPIGNDGCRSRSSEHFRRSSAFP